MRKYPTLKLIKMQHEQALF